MSIYRYERAGNFPKRRRVGINTVRWLDEDIVEWMRSRPVVDPVIPAQENTWGRRHPKPLAFRRWAKVSSTRPH